MTPITADAIRRALADAARTRNYDDGDLRESVVQFAGDWRANDIPPERVLIAVKKVADEFALPGLSDWWRSIITDRFVRWAVEGYYRIDLSGSSPPDRPPP